jgi:hypothetical protein
LPEHRHGRRRTWSRREVRSGGDDRAVGGEKDPFGKDHPKNGQIDTDVRRQAVGEDGAVEEEGLLFRGQAGADPAQTLYSIAMFDVDEGAPILQPGARLAVHQRGAILGRRGDPL